MHRGAALAWAYALAAALSGACAQPVAAQSGPRLTAPELAARLEKAGKDPVALLELVPLVAGKEGRGLRRQAKALLADRQVTSSPQERERLLRGLARVLPAAARTPAELRELLGPPRQVLRQVLYRRYREQWHYDTPLSYGVVIEGAKGQEARVHGVLVPVTARP